jgi:hypothetical protein
MKKISKTISLVMILSIISCIFVSVQAFAFEKTFPNGLYKVGTDIPAGTYSLEPLAGQKSLYYEIDSDNSNSIASIILLDKFDHKIVVILKDGQYLRVGNSERKIS